MACSVTLNNFVNSESTGGSFAFIGFSSSIGGSYTCSGYTWTGGPACNTAGTTPVSGGYTAAVDFTGTTVGFYKFRYSVGSGSCADSEDFIIQVVARPDSGTPNNPPPFCSGDTSTLTLASYLTGESTGGTWTRTTGTGGTFNAGAGTFNLTGAAVGTHTFKYTVTPTGLQSGYTIASGCSNCDSQNSDVIIQISTSVSAGTGLTLAVCN